MVVSERKVYEVEKNDTLSGISLKLLGNADLWNEKLYKEDGDTFTRGKDELIVPGQKIYYYEEDVEEKDEDSDLQVKEMEDIFTKTNSKAANEREKKIKEEWQQEEWNIGDSEYKLPPYKQYRTFKQENDQEIQDLKLDFRKELEASYFKPLVNDMESNIVISSVINKSIDEDNLPAPIRNRLHYILNKILTLEEGETVVEEMNNAYFTGTIEYTRDDYIREYRELEKFIESPFFQVANGVTVKVVNVFEALSQAYAGYTEAVIGKQFVELGGGLVATGLGTVAGGTVVAGIGVIVGGDYCVRNWSISCC